MVYVIQEQPGKNISCARKYGELKVILDRGEQIIASTRFVVKKMTTALRNFNDDDYVLLIGDPAAIGIAVAIASAYNKGKVKLLKWDRQDRLYNAVSFNLCEEEIDGNRRTDESDS